MGPGQKDGECDPSREALCFSACVLSAFHVNVLQPQVLLECL